MRLRLISGGLASEQDDPRVRSDAALRPERPPPPAELLSQLPWVTLALAVASALALVPLVLP